MSYKKGDVVTVMNSTFGGEPVVEGRAVLVKKCSNRSHLPNWKCWRVRFLDDDPRTTYARWLPKKENENED